MSALLRCLFILYLATSLGSAISRAAVDGDTESTQIIVIPKLPKTEVSNQDAFYFVNLLVLALEKTRESHGPYELRETSVFLSDNRLKAALRSGHVDLLWSPTSPEYERALLPVPVSLLGDLGEYRVLIIRKGTQAGFNNIETLDDLRQLTGGMGSHWADMDIMRANGIPVVSAIGYERLFRMLAAGRFDYFSRGLYQVSHEVELFPDLQLVMEENLLLHYPSRHYFFVNVNNKALAARVEQGLQLAMADGSYTELFYSMPRHQWARKELDSRRRKIIPLDISNLKLKNIGH